MTTSRKSREELDEKLQNKMSALFPQDTLPTHLSIHQVEALKARVVELEARLTSDRTDSGPVVEAGTADQAASSVETVSDSHPVQQPVTDDGTHQILPQFDPTTAQGQMETRVAARLPLTNSVAIGIDLHHTKRYALLGSLLGVFFPSLGTLVQLWLMGLTITLTNIVRVQSSTPLLWIIDSAPLILGLIAALAGREHDRMVGTNWTLQEQEQELQSARLQLEQRVLDRTHDIELASEVSRAVSEKISDLDLLLREATRLVRDRFDLYYTQIYLTDPTGQSLILRAGTGEVGEELLRRRHRLVVGPGSLNGQAAVEKRAVLVADTRKDPNFLPNSLLPNTRSEMAVPLIAGGQVVGVLDMQSEQPGALNELNLPVFEALAGQLAVALQNAALYSQAQEARSELELQVRGMTEQGWHEFLNAIERGQQLGYVFDQSQVVPMKAGALNPAPVEHKLHVPINFSGAYLGAVQVTKEPGRAWTNQEIEVTNVVASLLAQHLNSLRLLVQAESYRMEAEQALRRLTRENWDNLQIHGGVAPGYVFDLNEVKTVSKAGDELMQPALKQPLIVREETIGEFTLADAADSDEAREIVESVARRLSIHIENLRLSQEIEKRAYELATVANVSTAASTLLDPDQLLQSVVNLTKERFNLYHVHIYLADASWQTLLLTAGAGEIGQKMVSEGWNIPFNHPTSIVATAARTRGPYIVNDVYRSKHSGFLSNQLLPNTRSEMAVPMIVGETLLGVFDVQADRPGYFSEADANIFITLASQVAVALQNARLYAEQAATVTQLRELDRLKSAFLANMSHELRTPLNSIIGFSDVILDGLDGPITNHMENDLRLIQKNGRHLLHLINDVLDMAKIDAGRMNLQPENFVLDELLEDVVSLTTPLAMDKSLTLTVLKNGRQPLEVYADRTRIQQVMINLVNNAIKFTEQGEINIQTALNDHHVLIQVRDTGLGIPMDHLESIFHEFTQVDTSTTRKAGGTGLGLPISRRLVELHGGHLWVESSGVPGKGSTFFVELPLEARLTEPTERLER